MGDFATSTSTADKTENSQSKQEPWQAQQPYLQDIFQKAQGVYKKTNQNQYKGDFLQGYNQNQLDQFGNMVNYANTDNTGSLLKGQGQTLNGIGNTNILRGSAGLDNFNPSSSVQGNIDAAGQYANNPNISGMVDAAMRDSARNVYEGQLPANARAAAMNGNANSSKRFIGDAIAQRGLADRTADVSSQLRGDAYNTGLGLNQNMTQFNDQAMLDRAKAQGNFGLDTTNQGSGNLNSSVDIMKQLFGIGNEGGAGQQAAGQQTLDNNIMKSEYKNQNQWQNLMNYFKIIGGQNWGADTTSSGSSTADGSSTASPAAVTGGVLTGIGSLWP